MIIRKYVVKGLVQGIGYRPFVAKIADELNITGWVRNTGGIVTVLACGVESDIEEFYHRLTEDIPAGGFVSSIESIDVNVTEHKGQQIVSAYNDFKIIESNQDISENLPFIPADIATCEFCKRELLDVTNRRYMHPFISCTICGPRYSILEKLPYDRDTITMAEFDMCPKCRGEYFGKIDTRRHAQTIACKECGPSLTFLEIKHKITDNVTVCGKVDKSVDIYNENDLDAEISRACQLIKAGGILAVKDIGGYHLVCNPFDDKAVRALRILKKREEKPFAVMFEDLQQIKDYCQVNQKEEILLESPARPIVLLKSLGVKKLSANVCLNSHDIGAMLPCNPVQILLVKECGPLIMTSGNASGEVLEIHNEKMVSWLKKRSMDDNLKDIPIGILSHNRKIMRPEDDSVMKIVKGRQQFVRRGRGHVPNPIQTDIKGEILAAGGDLKSSFCYVKDGMAFVSQYLGDMESVSCQQFYKTEVKAMAKIFGFSPECLAADLHPGYFSKKNATEMSVNYKLPISYHQHHKAHVAAVIAEHMLKGPVLGFAFDGTGFGEDGAIWGSEAFIINESGQFNRVAHIKPVKLIGGNEGAKNCDTILSGFLYSAGLEDLDENPNAPILQRALINNINTVTSTSMGRLFDAVAALLDICHINSYEGQAPVCLENVAATVAGDGYKLDLGIDGDTGPLLKEIYDAKKQGIAVAEIAKGFILAVGKYIERIAVANQIKQVVVSGGTFLNRILLECVIELLEADGFQIYISEQLPPGDGSICLGQAFLAQFEN